MCPQKNEKLIISIVLIFSFLLPLADVNIVIIGFIITQGQDKNIHCIGLFFMK